MKTLQVVALMSFMVFGCVGVMAMGEPDIKIALKNDFVNCKYREFLLSGRDNHSCNALLDCVIEHVEHIRAAPGDFDFDYINPRNSKSVDVYLRAWVPSNTIKATLQVAPKDGVDYSVFARVPKKFKECGIDCELEFIKYEDRKLD